MPRRTQERRRTAHHEAGHVIACLWLDHHLERATIVPNHEDMEAGSATILPVWQDALDADDEAVVAEEALVIKFAGAAAERLFFGDPYPLELVGASSGDYSEALNIADSCLPPERQAAALQRAHARALRLMRAHRDDVAAVSKLLLRRGTVRRPAILAAVSERMRARLGRGRMKRSLVALFPEWAPAPQHVVEFRRQLAGAACDRSVTQRGPK